MVIRPATTDDVPRVLAVWRDAGAVPSATDDEASIAGLSRSIPARSSSRKSTVSSSAP